MARSTKSTPSTKAPTMQVIAEEAGCSIATVSKALNGLRVSAENLRKVNEVASRLGYVPNQAARTIRGGRTMTVGIVLNIEMDPRSELVTVVHRLISMMEEENYSVFFSVTPSAEQRDSLLRRLAERRVDGIFYWNAQETPALRLLERAGVAVLAIDHRDESCTGVPLLDIDREAGCRPMFERAAELGHRRVVDLGRTMSQASFRSVSAELGMEWDQIDVLRGDCTVSEAIDLVRRDGLSLVLAPYPLAVEVLAVCEQQRLTVPENLSVVATTYSHGAEMLRTPLTTLFADYDTLGEAAATTMLDLLGGGEPSDVNLSGCVSWVQRASLGPAPTSSPPRPSKNTEHP